MPTNRHDPLDPIRNSSDRQALEARRLFSLEAIWQRMVEDGGALFRDFNDEQRRTRVLRALFRAARREGAERKRGGWKRFWPDVVLVVFLFVFLGLGVRAVRLADSVAIALRDLRAGERLRSETLHGAKDLQLPDGKERGPALRLIENVAAGDYVFSEDLQRFEVIAAGTILKDSAIPAGAVRQEWRPFRRKEEAALLEQVAGNQASREIRAGETIGPDHVASESVLVEQLVTNKRLPRLHRITGEDFHPDHRPRQPGALLRREDAIGRYTLQEIEAGTSLVAGQLSPGALAADDLAGRQLVTLHVQPPSFRLMPQLPARAGLAATAPGERNVLLPNVLVLAVETGKDGPAVVVALTRAEILALMPLLPEAQVFVLQQAP